MCGIVGGFSWTGSGTIGREKLTAMRDRMRSRGPDDAGLFLQTQELPFVHLGHRRLSIVDLSDRGHQPMTTPDGSMTIVFNGEIFNFRELRQELRDTGLRYMGAPAVPALPSIGVRSNLKSGIVRGGRSYLHCRVATGRKRPGDSDVDAGFSPPARWNRAGDGRIGA